MILDCTDKLQRKKKHPDKDSIFDFLSKTVATNIAKDTLADSTSQLITIKKTPNSYDSLYLSSVDQREVAASLNSI